MQGLSNSDKLQLQNFGALQIFSEDSEGNLYAITEKKSPLNTVQVFESQDYLDSSGSHGLKNFGKNIVCSGPQSGNFLNAFNSNVSNGGKVGIIPTINNQRLIFYISVSQDQQSYYDGTAYVQKTYMKMIYNQQEIQISDIDLPKGIEIKENLAASQSINYGLKIPTIIRISGTFNTGEKNGATGNDLKLAVIVDKSVQKFFGVNQFDFVDNQTEEGCGGSSKKCYFFSDGGDVLIQANDDNWQLQQFIVLDSINLDNEIQAVFPVLLYPGKIPKTINLAIIQFNSFRNIEVLNTIRVFGASLQLINFATDNRYFQDVNSIIDSNGDWNSLSDFQNFASLNNIVASYGIKDLNQIRPVQELNSFVFLSEHTDSNNQVQINNQLNQGSGFTVCSLKENYFGTSAQIVAFDGNSSPSIKCIQQFKYKVVLQNNQYYNYLTYCPYDNLGYIDGQIGKGVTFDKITFPFYFGQLYPLADTFSYSWSTKTGQLVAFKNQALRIGNGSSGNACSVSSWGAFFKNTSMQYISIEVKHSISIQMKLKTQKVKIQLILNSKPLGIQFSTSCYATCSTPNCQISQDFLDCTYLVVGDNIEFELKLKDDVPVIFDKNSVYSIFFCISHQESITSTQNFTSKILFNGFVVDDCTTAGNKNIPMATANPSGNQNYMELTDFVISTPIQGANSKVSWNFKLTRDTIKDTIVRFTLGFLSSPKMLNNVFCQVLENATYKNYFPEGVYLKDVERLKPSNKFSYINYNTQLNSIDIGMKGGFSAGIFKMECEGFKGPDGENQTDFQATWIDNQTQNIIIQSTLKPIQYYTLNLSKVAYILKGENLKLINKYFNAPGFDGVYVFSFIPQLTKMSINSRIYIEFSQTFQKGLIGQGYFPQFVAGVQQPQTLSNYNNIWFAIDSDDNILNGIQEQGDVSDVEIQIQSIDYLQDAVFAMNDYNQVNQARYWMQIFYLKSPDYIIDEQFPIEFQFFITDSTLRRILFDFSPSQATYPQILAFQKPRQDQKLLQWYTYNPTENNQLIVKPFKGREILMFIKIYRGIIQKDKKIRLQIEQGTYFNEDMELYFDEEKSFKKFKIFTGQNKTEESSNIKIYTGDIFLEFYIGGKITTAPNIYFLSLKKKALFVPFEQPEISPLPTLVLLLLQTQCIIYLPFQKIDVPQGAFSTEIYINFPACVPSDHIIISVQILENVQNNEIQILGPTRAFVGYKYAHFASFQVGVSQNAQLDKTNIRAIVCGGDGSLMWVVSQIIQQGCDIEQCPIGVVPIGTGNDFSRVLGWGGNSPSELIGKNMETLKKMTLKWIQSIIEEFDIWDIKVETLEVKKYEYQIKKEYKKLIKNGHFKKIEKILKNGKTVLQKQIMQQKNSEDKLENIHVLRHKLSNYMSVGADARIGFGFDKNRTKSTCVNKMIYCWEGFKKNFLKTLKMDKVLQGLQQIQPDDIESDEVQIVFLQQQQNNNSNSKKIIIFKIFTKFFNQFKEINIDDIVLKGDPINILLLNINSYSQGVYDIWKNCRNKLALQKNNNKPIKDTFQEQNFGDGKIEFLSFYSINSIGMERIIKGQAHRVGQGGGPFILRFNKENNNKQPIVTYFQIDGEYYQVVSPKCIKISKCKQLPRGKIKVMVESSSVQTKV
ncbi:hypothetical protein IMG5_179490 [Ichthyophthirius multifiliis]|uniref:Diacylglycerol kinase n=1 Tax=Ichthyophthirius multifiliis TaxID=5932 RepID=G0R2M8_ICHMU|nr:hypothetical protein IMG5_179490 [Ichthyophthirius multifiliis]EGR28292.1 hypothetical protein IMG5_179490 [Ichthyophthirius multifiliis]|eukprot:XP_004027637.1 hypothetical protein IMG5_179490 [Ichthyophthirius multifiliis]